MGRILGMEYRPPLLIRLFAAGLVSLACLPAWAQDEQGARGQQRQRGEQGLSESVRRVEQRTGGQVLAAERMQFDGRDVNRIKVLDDSGRVRVFMDDPKASERRPSTRRDDD